MAPMCFIARWKFNNETKPTNGLGLFGRKAGDLHNYKHSVVQLDQCQSGIWVGRNEVDGVSLGAYRTARGRCAFPWSETVNKQPMQK